MANTTCEFIWLKALLQDLKVKHFQPMQLHCDNQTTLRIANNPVFHKCTKHREIDCHLKREKLTSGILRTSYVPTHSQFADIFTKVLGRDHFHFFPNKLGITNIHVVGD